MREKLLSLPAQIDPVRSSSQKVTLTNCSKRPIIRRIASYCYVSTKLNTEVLIWMIVMLEITALGAGYDTIQSLRPKIHQATKVGRGSGM